MNIIKILYDSLFTQNPVGWWHSVFRPVPSFVRSSQLTPALPLPPPMFHICTSVFSFLRTGFKGPFPNLVQSSLLGASSLLWVRGSEIFLEKFLSRPRSPPAGPWGEIRCENTPTPYNLTFTPTLRHTHCSAWIYVTQRMEPGWYPGISIPRDSLSAFCKRNK